MKKFLITLIAGAILITTLAVPSFAATSTKYFTADLDSSYSDTWFADVMLDGKVVGQGYTFYKKPFLFGDKKLSTEYQNVGLTRVTGSNKGANVAVNAYIKVGSSTSDSQTYSWSDDNWRGGSSTGWIQVDATTKRSNDVTEVGGYVKVTNTNTGASNTYKYNITQE